MLQLFLALLFLQAPPLVLDNGYLRVARNSAPCASAGATCAERVIVALGPIELEGQKMMRGDLRVFPRGQAYTPPKSGDYLEVGMKPAHPPVQRPNVAIEPKLNRKLYDGDRFFIYEERLAPGETRQRHSHAQRLAIVLNATRLEIFPEDGPKYTQEEKVDDVRFVEPTVHVTHDIGGKALRNIVIEFK